MQNVFTSSLLEIIAAPTFPDQERTRAARWLNIFLWLTSAFLLATLLTIWLGGWTGQIQKLLFLACAILLLINTSCWLFMRRGFIKIASFLILSTIFCIATYLNIAIFQSIRSPDVWVYFVLIPLSGLLLSRKLMAYFCAAAIGMSSLTFYLEYVGTIRSPLSTPANFNDFVILLVSLTMSTILLYSAIRKAEEKAEEARNSMFALIDSNRQLEHSQELLTRAQIELELRVVERTKELRAANQLLQAEIVARQELMDALSRSEANWRSLVENAPELIVTADPQGQVLFVNRAADVQAASLEIGCSLTNLHQEVKYQILLTDAVQRVLNTGELVSYESEDLLNGTPIWRVNRLGAIQQNDTIHSLILISTDITEQKQTEMAMQHAQKLESLGLMAGGIAHDFNNLLAAMLGQATLALSKIATPSAVYEHLQNLMLAGHRATDLTRQMLNYAGRGSTNTKLIDLNNLIRENIQFFSASIPKTIELIARPFAGLPPIQGDPGQIQQLLMNLLLNGADAIGTQPGSIAVTTALRQIQGDEGIYWRWTSKPLSPGAYVELLIQDTGCGMDGSTLDKIFDPFFTTKFTGRGLGLASVLGIVRTHEGGMYVTSKLGQGTTFRMLFPVAEVSVSNENKPPSNLVPVDLEDKTVLIVDDEDDVREVTSEILQLSGLQTLTAANGMAALRLYAQHREQIDLVLLDLSMPGMTGEQVVKALWEIKPSLPIVLLSGYDEHEVSRRLGENRQMAFLQKPYTVEAIIATIEQQLAQVIVQA